MTDTFDFIVIGAGTAGSIIARRLVDAGKQVLVLEAGDEDTNPAIHDVGRLGELWFSPQDWGYRTVPQPGANGRRLHLPRGKVLGGSHQLNAAIWVRCAPEDFDGWEAEGNPGWGWDVVSEVYRSLEDFDGGAGGGRGVGGPIPVRGHYPLSPIQTSIIHAAEQAGIRRSPDYNVGTPDGVGPEQVNIVDGVRRSNYVSFLKPVRDAAHLTIRTGAWAHRLLLEGTTVVGVEYEVDGTLQRAHAAETILTAGALDSPRLLLLSGIGPADHLRAVGIEVRHDLPGVGENLHDHFLSPQIFSTEKEIAPPEPGVSATQSHWFARSRPELAVPDTQPITFSVPMYNEGQTGPGWGFSLMAGLIRTKSRGRLRLRSSDPHDVVDIDLGTLTHPDDVAALVWSARQAHEVGAQSALADGWGARRIWPAEDLDDDALEQYVRDTVITYHHQVGTTRMGVGPDAVVTPRLKVHGLDGLRVADAGIMPFITSGNTNAPTSVIGELAARFILSGE